MANPSNLYAEKIYSEHPLVLWALDDKLDYIGLISEAQRNIADDWTVTNATASVSTTYLKQPFPNSVLNLIQLDNAPPLETLEAYFISDTILNFNDLESSFDTFTIGTYFYSNSIFIDKVSIGYEYTDPDTLSIVQNLKSFTSWPYQSWGLISETFIKPDLNVDFRIVFKITIFAGSGDPVDNQFYFNGITIGQWNEEFNANSYGVTPITIPADISIYGGLEAVEAQAYGIAEDSGYYITEGGLKCKNSGMPLVYGASGVTKLEPSTDASLIIPGKGFLNQSGKYNDYTIEFWTKINSNTANPRKIFGPIASSDGLYVENGFLTLVIGNQFASHFVGEWFRPMLIHIRLIKNAASLLINGEEVFSLSINTENLVLPTQLDIYGNSQDWLGFYAYADVYPFELDCIAIYSYQVPITVAKRRWVYGQGVASAEVVNASYSGTTAFIDYSFADYTANYNYPDFAKWNQGAFDNLITTSTSLRTPEYILPEIFIGTKTLQELYEDNKDIQDNESGPVVVDKFLSFKPNNSWNSINSYINFPKFNLLSSQVESFYGVFSSHNLVSQEILFKIYNPITKDYFMIMKDGDEIKYSLTYNGISEILFTSDPILSNNFFSVGLNLTALVNEFGNNVPAFFGNQNVLKMYVCGDESEEYSFTGRLYSIGISTSKNYSKISENFDSNGIVLIENGQQLISHTASYTLLPSEAYNKYFLDIGVAGYWEDYLPLSYFGQFVKNAQGEDFYDLDFLQFNIGYPEVTNFSIDTVDGGLYNEAGTILNEGFYNTLEFESTFNGGLVEDGDEFEYNTENSQIKSYATFQYLVDGANIPTAFTNEKALNKYKIIDLSEHADWETTRFEILNNTLIYPVKNIDFNKLAIVYSLEFNTRGILSKPILLNRLQFSSQALNDNSDNYVGTRFGADLVPYKKNGIYYSYKSKNPFSIYKESTPYLYLTKNSGIEVRGKLDILENRGLSLPINKELSTDYRVSAIQLWMKYDQETFPLTATELFEINYNGGIVKVYFQANSPDANRGRLFALNEKNIEYNGLAFYLNGTIVREPVLSIKEWSSIGISFLTPLSFSSYLGNINVTGPALFNNISYYKASSLQEIEKVTRRPWYKVVTDGVGTLDWQFWLNNFTWDGVLILGSSQFYGINPSDIYKTYIGTNKIIIDDNEGLVYQPEKMKIYTETEWLTNVSIPL
jgi:hypothetical protein